MWFEDKHMIFPRLLIILDKNMNINVVKKCLYNMVKDTYFKVFLFIRFTKK